MDDHITRFDANGNVQIGSDSAVSRILESNPEDYSRWKAWNTSNFDKLRRAANTISSSLDKIRTDINKLKSRDIPAALLDQITMLYRDVQAVQDNVPNFNLRNEQDIFRNLIEKLPNIKTRF